MRRHQTKPICLSNEHGIHSLSNLLRIRMRLGLLCKILAVLGSSKTPARIMNGHAGQKNRTSLASRSLVSCQFDSNHCEAHRFTVVHLPFFCFFHTLENGSNAELYLSYPVVTHAPSFPTLRSPELPDTCMLLLVVDPWLQSVPRIHTSMASHSLQSTPSNPNRHPVLPNTFLSHRIVIVYHTLSESYRPLSAPTLLAVYLWKVLSTHLAKQQMAGGFEISRTWNKPAKKNSNQIGQCSTWIRLYSENSAMATWQTKCCRVSNYLFHSWMAMCLDGQVCGTPISLSSRAGLIWQKLEMGTFQQGFVLLHSCDWCIHFRVIRVQKQIQITVWVGQNCVSIKVWSNSKCVGVIDTFTFKQLSGSIPIGRLCPCHHRQISGAVVDALGDSCHLTRTPGIPTELWNALRCTLLLSPLTCQVLLGAKWTCMTESKIYSLQQ